MPQTGTGSSEHQPIIKPSPSGLAPRVNGLTNVTARGACGGLQMRIDRKRKGEVSPLFFHDNAFGDQGGDGGVNGGSGL